MTAEGKQDNILKIKTVVAAIFCGAPWFFMWTTYLISPGYILPFLNEMPGKTVVLIMAIWDLLWFLFLVSTKSNVLSVLVIIFFVLPLNLVPMLGPAVGTIIKSLGPIYSEKGISSGKSGATGAGDSSWPLGSPNKMEADGLAMKAGLLAAQRQYDTAIDMCTRAIAMDPQNYYPYLQRGYAHQMAGHDDNALSDFRKAVELNPRNADSRSRLGYLLAKLGLTQEALDQYNRAIELSPDNKRAILMRAELYDKLGMPDKAAAERARAEQVKIPER